MRERERKRDGKCAERWRGKECVLEKREGVCRGRDECVKIKKGSVRGERKRGRYRVCAE